MKGRVFGQYIYIYVNSPDRALHFFTKKRHYLKALPPVVPVGNRPCLYKHYSYFIPEERVRIRNIVNKDFATLSFTLEKKTRYTRLEDRVQTPANDVRHELLCPVRITKNLMVLIKLIDFRPRDPNFRFI